LLVGFFFRRRGKAGLVGAAMTFKEGLELMVDPNMNAAAPQGGLLSKSTSLQQQPSRLSCNVQQGAGGVDLLLHEHQDVQLGPGGDPEAAAGGTTGTPGSSTTGKSVRPLPVSRDTVHRVGQDSWWEVGFHFIAALDNAFILGYPALIMAYLGWATGTICLIGGGIVSFYNNCLLGSLHETGGKRHIRYRDLAGHIYGNQKNNSTEVLFLLLFQGQPGPQPNPHRKLLNPCVSELHGCSFANMYQSN
jgi:hypothetical protein